MASRLAAALLLLGLICTGLSRAEVAVDCCLSTTDKFFPLIRISTYKLQIAGEGCDISATVFITKTANTICIVHPTDSFYRIQFLMTLNRVVWTFSRGPVEDRRGRGQHGVRMETPLTRARGSQPPCPPFCNAPAQQHKQCPVTPAAGS
ncbi:unnamed protein product [Pleuronectes platessa]|uniref:Chemokine interleukin-8-like domain-containing protein n=1 Tax=Pleuronectes platessa TaxID=8262 RepID=A0A9N7TZP1_PLEPL|nr:unnamed protein product [Pleuronectes platessa]